MKILIIEDEPLASERLIDILKEQKDAFEIIGKFDSVRSSVNALKSGLEFDLLFCDINLADGTSFDIFKQVKVSQPVIFITAYDEHALKAFDVHCIDYILKPISKSKVEKALSKYKQIRSHESAEKPQITELLLQELEHFKTDKYKKRFLAKVGNRLAFVKAEEVSYFYADGKIVYLVESRSGNKYIIDHSLEELEKSLLDPNQFYRINRSFIVNLDDLLEIKSYYNGRLKLHVNTHCEKDIIVAREKVSNFKSWLNQ